MVSPQINSRMTTAITTGAVTPTLVMALYPARGLRLKSTCPRRVSARVELGSALMDNNVNREMTARPRRALHGTCGRQKMVS